MSSRNKSVLSGICFFMEKQVRTIYYITTGMVPEKNKSTKKRLGFPWGKRKEEALPVYRCARNYLYAGGKPSAAGNPPAAGEVRIYFSMLPDNLEVEWKKSRSRKKWLNRISAAMNYATEILGCIDQDDILFSEELNRLIGRDQNIPQELYGVLLWTYRKQRSFKSLSISLPKDCGLFGAESVITLLEPYLAGVNIITFMDEETQETELLEDYFYDEYGIVTDYDRAGSKNSCRLEFGEEREIWKFLDTAVKSGYNTKVN